MKLRACTLLVLLPALVPGTLRGGSQAASAWLDIPFVRQTGAGCGSAAIAMVIQYWARQNPALTSAAAETERID